MSGQNVWATLVKAGVVQGPAPQTESLESPWYVKILLALSGWIAAVCLLGFIGVAFYSVFQHSTAAFVLGSVMICCGFMILRAPQNVFLEHLALALSMAGQALVVYRIFGEHFYGIETGDWVLVVLLQSLLAVVMPNFVHRVFSACVAAFAFSMALTYTIGLSFIASGVIMLIAAWCWLNEFRYPAYMRMIQAIGYGLILAVIVLKGTELYGYGDLRWFFGGNEPKAWNKPWMSEVLTGAVTLYVVWNLLQRSLQPLSERLSMMVLFATVIVCVLSVEVHGLTVGMVIVLLGFAGANRPLLGLGITSLLSYISSYYYLLDTTLLAKSITLVVVGIALLVFRWLMLRMVSADKEEKHV
jgi:uncharacterized membrane protein